jgi:hypothetical protein
MVLIASFFAVLGLGPLFLYLIGKQKDPFHPLIFAGALFYFVCAHRVFTSYTGLLALLPESFYIVYIMAAILSLLGLYAGWWWAGRRYAGRFNASNETSPRYNPSQLMLAATFCAALGTGTHFIFYERYDISAYIRDWGMLWISAAILSVQCFIISRPHRPWAVLVLLISIAPPIDRFLVYGQRGDTFRLAVLVLLAYLMLNRRPSKAVFVTAAFSLAVVLGTLQLTRKIVDRGDATNRFTALREVIPSFFRADVEELSTGEEMVFGSAAIAGIRYTGQYGYGLNLTLGFASRFLPRQLFPDKGAFLQNYGGYHQTTIDMTSGITITQGAAPTGTTNGFTEFSWFCFLPWIIVGYFYRRLWDLATLRPSIVFKGLFAAYTMALIYAISQDLVSFEMYLVYMFIPLPLIYRFARIREADRPAEQPLQPQPYA